jgi:hypothetical protein
MCSFVTKGEIVRTWFCNQGCVDLYYNGSSFQATVLKNGKITEIASYYINGLPGRVICQKSDDLNKYFSDTYVQLNPLASSYQMHINHRLKGGMRTDEESVGTELTRLRRNRELIVRIDGDIMEAVKDGIQPTISDNKQTALQVGVPAAAGVLGGSGVVVAILLLASGPPGWIVAGGGLIGGGVCAGIVAPIVYKFLNSIRTEAVEVREQIGEVIREIDSIPTVENEGARKAQVDAIINNLKRWGYVEEYTEPLYGTKK